MANKLANITQFQPANDVDDWFDVFELALTLANVDAKEHKAHLLVNLHLEVIVRIKVQFLPAKLTDTAITYH